MGKPKGLHPANDPLHPTPFHSHSSRFCGQASWYLQGCENLCSPAPRNPSSSHLFTPSSPPRASVMSNITSSRLSLSLSPSLFQAWTPQTGNHLRTPTPKSPSLLSSAYFVGLWLPQGAYVIKHAQADKLFYQVGRTTLPTQNRSAASVPAPYPLRLELRNPKP